MTITERMKKYAELLSVESMTSKTEKDIFSDLQATVQALEVARAIIFPICQFESGAEVNSSFDEPYAAKKAREAIKTIDQILGAKP